jgi:hypothetical protein
LPPLAATIAAASKKVSFAAYYDPMGYALQLRVTSKRLVNAFEPY